VEGYVVFGDEGVELLLEGVGDLEEVFELLLVLLGLLLLVLGQHRRAAPEQGLVLDLLALQLQRQQHLTIRTQPTVRPHAPHAPHATHHLLVGELALGQCGGAMQLVQAICVP
jgi:hypothetical protein